METLFSRSLRLKVSNILNMLATCSTIMGRSPAIIREIYLACIASDVMPSPCPFPPLQTNLFQSEIVGPGESSKLKPLPQIASYLLNDGKSHQWASVFACGK